MRAIECSLAVITTCWTSTVFDAAFIRLEGESPSATKAVADAAALSTAGVAASEAFLLLMLCLPSCYYKTTSVILTVLRKTE